MNVADLLLGNGSLKRLKVISLQCLFNDKPPDSRTGGGRKCNNYLALVAHQRAAFQSSMTQRFLYKRGYVLSLKDEGIEICRGNAHLSDIRVTEAHMHGR